MSTALELLSKVVEFSEKPKPGLGAPFKEWVESHLTSITDDGTPALAQAGTKVPIATTYIFRNGEEFHVTKGIKDLDGNAADNKTQLAWYSSTKVITAIMAMRMATKFGEYRFSIEDPASKWFPQIKDITIARVAMPSTVDTSLLDDTTIDEVSAKLYSDGTGVSDVMVKNVGAGSLTGCLSQDDGATYVTTTYDEAVDADEGIAVKMLMVNTKFGSYEGVTFYEAVCPELTEGVHYEAGSRIYGTTGGAYGIPVASTPYKLVAYNTSNLTLGEIMGEQFNIADSALGFDRAWNPALAAYGGSPMVLNALHDPANKQRPQDATETPLDGYADESGSYLPVETYTIDARVYSLPAYYSKYLFDLLYSRALDGSVLTTAVDFVENFFNYFVKEGVPLILSTEDNNNVTYTGSSAFSTGIIFKAYHTLMAEDDSSYEPIAENTIYKVELFDKVDSKLWYHYKQVQDTVKISDICTFFTPINKNENGEFLNDDKSYSQYIDAMNYSPTFNRIGVDMATRKVDESFEQPAIVSGDSGLVGTAQDHGRVMSLVAMGGISHFGPHKGERIIDAIQLNKLFTERWDETSAWKTSIANAFTVNHVNYSIGGRVGGGAVADDVIYDPEKNSTGRDLRTVSNPPFIMHSWGGFAGTTNLVSLEKNFCCAMGTQLRPPGQTNPILQHEVSSKLYNDILIPGAPVE